MEVQLDLFKADLHELFDQSARTKDFSWLHDNVKSNILRAIGTIVNRGHCADFKLTFDLGAVINYELQRGDVLALPYIDRE